MNLYVTKNTNQHAILFSKKEVAKFKKIYPKCEFSVTDNLNDAFYFTKYKNNNKKSVYAIRKGIVKGIFLEPKLFDKMSKVKGREGKKCSDIYDAYFYIYKKKPPKQLCSITTSVKDDCGEDVKPKGTYAYTDGSYILDNDIMGIGYELYLKSGVFSHSTFIVGKNGSSNKAELTAAMMVVDRAIKEGVKNITIYHDAEQVSRLATGKSKSKDSFNKKYYQYMNEKSKMISIHFAKVKAHSTDKKNKKVDAMISHNIIEQYF